MLDHTGDLFKKRAARLDLARGDQLSQIQSYLDKLYPGQCRAASLNSGVLKITTPNSSVASELRFRQEEILVNLKRFNIIKLVLIVRT